MGFSRATISRVQALKGAARTERMTKRIFEHDRSATRQKTAAVFNLGPLASISVTIIQENITYMGFQSLYTATQKAFCLALQHQYRTLDDWKYVAWSDESHLQLYRADGHVR